MTPEALAALDPDELKALVSLHRAGYRVMDGKIYKTVTEPEEGESIWTGEFIADSSGWFQQDFDDLQAAGRPRHALEIMCNSCGENDVPDLGDRCGLCQRVEELEIQAEKADAIRRGK